MLPIVLTIVLIPALTVIGVLNTHLGILLHPIAGIREPIDIKWNVHLATEHHQRNQLLNGAWDVVTHGAGQIHHHEHAMILAIRNHGIGQKQILGKAILPNLVHIQLASLIGLRLGKLRGVTIQFKFTNQIIHIPLRGTHEIGIKRFLFIQGVITELHHGVGDGTRDDILTRIQIRHGDILIGIGTTINELVLSGIQRLLSG